MGQDSEIRKLGIIGAGAMGSGIAQVAATANWEVVLVDVSKEALEQSQQKLGKILHRLVEKGRMTKEQADSIRAGIHYAEHLRQLKDCDLLIEAVVENLEIKKKIFMELEAVVSKDCIIASNTSSLSITALAAALKKPDRCIGIHFFNPAPLMKLVEIIPALQTLPAVTESAKSIIASWGKQVVLAKDTPGFIVNKVARPFYSEALRIYEEGMADFPTIDWALTELGGFQMGPFQLMDFIGHDVNYTVTQTVFNAFYQDGRYKPSFAQKRLVEAGYLGKKAGRGFYQYTFPEQNPEPVKDPEVGKQILERVIIMLINEAADTLHFQIASREDIEIAMTKGVNYPKGLLHWADEIGIAECVRRMDALFEEYREERYRCSPLLRKMARLGQTFL